MQKLSNYIENLDFEYAITYSGLRGKAWEELKVENRSKVKQLEKDLEAARYMQKMKLGQEIEALLHEVDAYESRIIHANGSSHKSTQQVQRLEKGSGHSIICDEMTAWFSTVYSLGGASLLYLH